MKYLAMQMPNIENYLQHYVQDMIFKGRVKVESLTNVDIGVEIDLDLCMLV